MARITRKTMTAAVALALVQPALGFWRMSCGLIQTGRVDPVINYGVVSQHVHKVAGASNFNINSTFASLSASNCTSCQIQADKSAYWTPQLYYQHANGQYEEVPNTGMTVYYLGRGTDNSGNSKASPFPEGLKMLSGNNNARTKDLTTRTWGNSSFPSRLVSERVSFVCINYADETGSETYNITGLYCPQGFRAQIQMQSCWDGVNLYLPDQSHVAYLSQIDNGICPPDHPILLPHLFYEVFYSINGFNGGDGKFVFANGDTTGYAFHGDFQNGWDTPTLTAAIDQCLIGNVNGVVEDCAVFTPSNINNYDQVCPERTPIYPCEKVKGILNSLPGCINPTGYGQVADSTCPGGNSVACAPNYNTRAPGPWTGSSAFSPFGCWTEATNSRALKEKSYTSTTNMTAQSCFEFCGPSYKYFGTEYGQECYCGNTLQSGSVPAPALDCKMLCTADVWQTCGAGNRLNVYQIASSASSSSSSIISSTSSSAKSSSSTAAATSSTKVPLPTSTKYPNPAAIANYAYAGCYTEATSGRALRDSSSTTSPMTLNLCANFCSGSTYFGVEYAGECYCGMTLQPGAVLATSQDDCSMKCAGNQTQYCGAGSRLSVYTQTSPAPLKYPEPSTVLGKWAYQGCYSDQVSGRALASTFLYGDANAAKKMTLELCGTFCAGYTYFGTEYAQECYCGNTLQGGSALAANQNDCSSKCVGDSTEYCGAAARLNLYSILPTQSWAVTAAASSTKAAGSTLVTVVTTSSAKATTTSSTKSV